MADSVAFMTVCEEFEAGSALDRLEARGTVRLALKRAGLEARSVTSVQLAVVIEKVLPRELAARGVDVRVCERLLAALRTLPEDLAVGTERPEDLFSRLGL